MKRHVLPGMVFGRLTVVERAGEVGQRNARWRCACECGGEAVASSIHLNTGHTRSCGCIHKEAHRHRLTTHGHDGTRTHTSWQAMRQRVLDPNHPGYPNYGGRGITIAARWESFAAFLEDMGERPAGTSLDRIDVNGDYGPDNCRWATRAEQAKNTRRAIASATAR